jgi:site-specific DNA-methyltransferase (adenine-specific)
MQQSAPQLIPVDKLADHPQNPRIALRDDVVAAISANLADGFDAAHALIVRPHGDGYQVISGHHRKAAAAKSGIEAVPCWVRDMDDEAAYMALATSNSQGELSPLEIGLHALHINFDKRGRGAVGGGMKEYASSVGKASATITEYRQAAKVMTSINSVDRINEMSTRAQHLAAIHALPQECWPAAVQLMLDRGWSGKDTKHWVDQAREFTIPDRWQAVFLPLHEVVIRFLQTREFSNQTVKRLINEAERVELLLEDAKLPKDAWLSWLSANAGEASWDVRLVSQRGREIENEIDEAAKSGIVAWHHGNWRDHIDSLEDGSVAAIVTDPPYGVDYQSDYRLDRRSEHKHERIKKDGDLQGAAHEMQSAFTALAPKLKADASIFVFCSWKNEFETRAAVEAAGFLVRNSIVWVKNRTGMGDPNTTFAPKHERIIFAVKGSPILSERLPDVLEADRPDSSRHPTEKPTDLLSQLIGVTTVQGDLVADPFGGVASTVVAAVESGRRGWGCEISAEYHDAGKDRL